jgi:hypothetical protein
MEILFNKSENGQAEITKLLGFLSNDFTFERILIDIKLNTPQLVRFISKAAYDKIVVYYKKAEPSAEEKTKFASVLEYAQLYVLCLAYLDYSSNNDLMHTTAGRKMNASNDEKTPWDWQIASDNAAQMKRAYKTLNQLIAQLEVSELAEWLASNARKKAKLLFVNTTEQFDEIYPIDNSSQLYYRMVPFMASLEETEVLSRLGETLYVKLKKGADLEGYEKIIVAHTKNGIVYSVLAKAYKVFPIEMFPDKIILSKNRADQLKKYREELIIYFISEAAKYFIKIEQELANQNAITSDELIVVKDLMQGLDADSKHVDL